MSSSASSGRGSGSDIALLTAVSISAFTLSDYPIQRLLVGDALRKEVPGKPPDWLILPGLSFSPLPAGTGTGRAASGR